MMKRVLLSPAFLFVFIGICLGSGCYGSYSCSGKNFGDTCTFNGSAGFCESTGGYCLLACSGPRGSCDGAGSGTACYWLGPNAYVCRGAGDPGGEGNACDGRINSCGPNLWCISTGNPSPICMKPCRNNGDCGGGSGVACTDLLTDQGMNVCAPVVP